MDLATRNQYGANYYRGYRCKTTKNRPFSGRFFCLLLAVPTGLGFATRNYLGAQ